MPFSRTHIKAFVDKLNEAMKQGDRLTISDIKRVFTTPAWSEALKDDNSTLCHVLRHKVFKDEGMEQNELNPSYLTVFAILHCVGNPSDKATAFYNVLQDGGLALHKYISANDKDFAPVFKRMCGMVTYELFDMMNSIDGTKHLYSEDEREELKESHEFVREDDFLEEIYGKASKLTNKLWMVRVIGNTWIFDSKAFRKQVLDKANLKLKLPEGAFSRSQV